MEALAVSLPILILTMAGAALMRLRWIDDAFLEGVNKFVYRVSLPALIIHSLCSSTLDLSAAFRPALAFCIATTLALLPGWVTGKLLHFTPAQTATLTQAGFRGNLAFVGFPVLAGAMPGDTTFLALGVLIFAPALILYNVLAVLLLNHASAAPGPGRTWKAVLAIRSNPLILAAAAGGLLGLLPGELPGVVLRSLEMLGKPAGPMALVCIGAMMVKPGGEGATRGAIAAAGLKLAVAPALVLGVAYLTGVGGTGLQVIMIYACCPSAAASYIVARELGGDAHLASRAVVLTTLICLVPLTVVLAVFFT